MNTNEISAVSKAIRKVREDRSLNQHDFAKALGVSKSYVSVIENMSATHGNIITPAIYDAILKMDVDLKTEVTDLIIIRRRGKERNFNPDLSVKIKEKDPFDMMHQAIDILKSAMESIKHKINSIDSQICENRKAIDEFESVKKNIINEKDKCADEILKLIG